MEKNTNIKVVARNKKASHEYFILDTLEVGIQLTGTEIKSIRLSKVSIKDAYCDIINGELYIINMHIAKFKEGNIFNHEELRDRRLLAHKKQILKLSQKKALEGLTIIPLDIIIKRGLAKLNIAVCKGKKNYDKRNDLKIKQMKRDINKRKYDA